MDLGSDAEPLELVAPPLALQDAPKEQLTQPEAGYAMVSREMHDDATMMQ